MSVIAALIVGLNPPLKALFFGQGAALGTITSAFDMVGVAVVPLTLLTLGSSVCLNYSFLV